MKMGIAVISARRLTCTFGGSNESGNDLAQEILYMTDATPVSCLTAILLGVPWLCPDRGCRSAARRALSWSATARCRSAERGPHTQSRCGQNDGVIRFSKKEGPGG